MSRSALKFHSITKQFDKSCSVSIPTGHHTAANFENDINVFVEQFQRENSFEEIPRRFHTAFRKINHDLLGTLDMAYIQNWIYSSLEKYGRKQFYPKLFLIYHLNRPSENH